MVFLCLLFLVLLFSSYSSTLAPSLSLNVKDDGSRFCVLVTITIDPASWSPPRQILRPRPHHASNDFQSMLQYYSIENPNKCLTFFLNITVRIATTTTEPLGLRPPQQAQMSGSIHARCCKSTSRKLVLQVLWLYPWWSIGPCRHRANKECPAVSRPQVVAASYLVHPLKHG